MTESLKSKTLSGVAWSLFERFGSGSVQFLLSIFIARLLSPKDFGVMGIVMIFITLSQVFINSGFGTALIQKKEPTDVDYNSVFFFNLFVAMILYIVLYISAPFIEKFFEFKELSLYIRVAGILLILNAFQLVQRTILQKKIHFRAIALVTISAVIISGAIGLFMAMNEYGIWSIIGQSLSNALILTIGFWVSSVWVPTFKTSLQSLKVMFKFSSKILATALIDTAMKSLSSLLIGKFYTPTDLGYYYRGKRFQEFPATNITQAIRAVTFPVLVSIQGDDNRQKIAYKKIIRVMVFFMFPTLFILAGSANNFIIILLTEKWSGATIYLQILALGGMLYPLHAVTLNICNVKGRSDIFLKLEIIKKTIYMLLILIAINFGIIALVIAESLISFIAYFFNAYYSGKLIEYSLTEQLKDIAPIYIPAAISGLVCLLIGSYIHSSLYLSFILQVTTATSLYLLLTFLFHRSIIDEVLGIFKK